MLKIHCFQCLKCEDLLVFQLAFYDNKLSIFGFWTTSNVKTLLWAFRRVFHYFQRLHRPKINLVMISNENNQRHPSICLFLFIVTSKQLPHPVFKLLGLQYTIKCDRNHRQRNHWTKRLLSEPVSLVDVIRMCA